MGKTVLVLGAGIGGIVAAEELRRRLPAEHRVVAVERERTHVFSPSLLWYVTGDSDVPQFTRPLDALRRRGIELVTGEITRLDPRVLTVDVNGKTIVADALVVALGADYAVETVPGLAEAGHNLYTLDGSAELRQALQAFAGGRIAVLTAAPGYKCPAAPYEAAMLIEALVRRRGLREKTEIRVHAAEPAPMPVAGPVAGAQIVAMLERKGIEYFPQRQVTRVEPGVLHFNQSAQDRAEQLSADFDLLVYVPPYRAPAVLRDAGLCGETGWILVDRQTLATSVPGVWAIGDVTSIPLKMASLAGDGFVLDWIAASTELSELELVDAADRAVHANFLVESDEGYRFTHDLIRRSLDDALTAERRRLLHRRLAAAMDSSGAPSAVVARHLEAGGRPVEAIRHRVRAAEAAARIHALPEALAQYDAAIAAGARGSEAFRIRSQCIEICRNLGDDGGRQAALSAMAELAATSEDPSQQVELAVKQTVDHFEHDRYEAALQTAQGALERLRGRIDAVSEAALLLELGATLKALGRIDEAESQLSVALERYREVSPLKFANCAYWLCQCAIERGDLARAHELCELSLAATARADYRRGHALSLSISADISARRGDLAGAVERLESACREAREIGSLPLQRAFLGMLIERLRQGGRDEQAERWVLELAALPAR